MKEYLKEIGLCGVLPCLRVEKESLVCAALDALAGEGFPVAEVDCTGTDDGYKEAFFSREGIAVGALAHDPAQAEKAFAAGAMWVTLMEDAEKPSNGKTFYHRRDARIRNKQLSSHDAAPSFLLCRNREQAEAALNADPITQLMVSGCESAEECRRWLVNPRIKAVRIPAGGEEGFAEKLKKLWADTLGFSLAHIGINGADAQEAAGTAKAFAALLGMPYRPGSASDYAGTIIEAMKEPGRGTHGHIGIATDDLERGMYFANRAGFLFDPASRKNDANGNAVLYYLNRELAGFAVHLLQRPRRS